MNEQAGGRDRGGVVWIRLGQAVAVLAAAPFLIGAVPLWIKLAHLEITAGSPAASQLLGSALFATGVGLGIIGSAFALSAGAVQKRVFCTALTLFGLAYVLLGLYMREAVEAGRAGSAARALLAAAVAVVVGYSLVLVLRLPKIAAEQKAEHDGEKVNEEQPQALSPP